MKRLTWKKHHKWLGIGFAFFMLMFCISGMFVWDRKAQMATDYFTGEITEEVAGLPFGKFAVSGYTEHLADKPVVVEYNQGTDAAVMPPSLSTLGDEGMEL